MVKPFLVLISECHFGDGPSLFKHIANVQKSTSKSVSISQLDVILTPNWYHLTPNPLFPTSLEANYHIFQSRPIIHSAFSLKHNKRKTRSYVLAAGPVLTLCVSLCEVTPNPKFRLDRSFGAWATTLIGAENPLFSHALLQGALTEISDRNVGVRLYGPSWFQCT